MFRVGLGLGEILGERGYGGRVEGVCMEHTKVFFIFPERTAWSNPPCSKLTCAVRRW